MMVFDLFDLPAIHPSLTSHLGLMIWVIVIVINDDDDITRDGRWFPSLSQICGDKRWRYKDPRPLQCWRTTHFRLDSPNLESWFGGIQRLIPGEGEIASRSTSSACLRG